MVTYSELVDTLDQLTTGEMLELKRILDERWVSIRQDEILAEVATARKESKEGKTLILSSQEEIRKYFSKSKGVDMEPPYKKNKDNLLKHFGSNPKEADGLTYQKKVRKEWD